MRASVVDLKSKKCQGITVTEKKTANDFETILHQINKAKVRKGNVYFYIVRCKTTTLCVTCDAR